MSQNQDRIIKDFDFRALGAEIKRARNEMKMTRDELAEAMSVSSSHLANIENKGTHPGFMLFIKLIKYLNISADEFIFQNPGPVKGIKLQVLTLVEECESTDLYTVRGVLQGIQESKQQENEQRVVRRRAGRRRTDGDR